MGAVLIFLVICMAVFGIVIVIPYLVKHGHDIENDDNHLYNIFMEVSGYRGFKLTTSMLLFMPIGIINFPEPDKDGYLSVFAISILWLFCLHTHISLYKNREVLDKNIKKLIAWCLSLSVVASYCEYMKLLSNSYIVGMVCGFVLGFFVVLKNAKLQQKLGKENA